MACFIVPMTQAIATSIARRRMKGRVETTENPWLHQLPKLELMLWGGTLMLIVDHILNGEMTWEYPFFTILAHKEGFHLMMGEMLGVGLPMSVVISLFYVGLVARETFVHKRV